MPLTCITHPECSHNTNGRDINKPCSIAYPTPTSGGWRERFQAEFMPKSDASDYAAEAIRKYGESCMKFIDSELTKAVEAERERVQEWVEKNKYRMEEYSGIFELDADDLLTFLNSPQDK